MDTAVASVTAGADWAAVTEALTPLPALFGDATPATGQLMLTAWLPAAEMLLARACTGAEAGTAAYTGAGAHVLPEASTLPAAGWRACVLALRAVRNACVLAPAGQHTVAARLSFLQTAFSLARHAQRCGQGAAVVAVLQMLGNTVAAR
jgi:hypothetical protein